MADSGSPKRGEAVLIGALLAGQTIVEAARTAHISERTAARLLTKPRVRQDLAEGRNQAIAGAVTQLAAAAATAAKTLSDLAEHATQEHVRLAAATRVLELAIKVQDQLDLVQRIEALESSGPSSRPGHAAPGARS